MRSKCRLLPWKRKFPQETTAPAPSSFFIAFYCFLQLLCPVAVGRNLRQVLPSQQAIGITVLLRHASLIGSPYRGIIIVAHGRSRLAGDSCPVNNRTYYRLKL